MPAPEKLIEVFEYALNQEHTGLSFFQTSLQRLSLGAAISAFQRLIAEEKGHVAYIEGILSGLKAAGVVSTGAAEAEVLAPVDYFSDRARSEFLEEGLAGSMVPDVTVFNLAWLVEKDIAEYYEMAARQVEGPAGEALARLAAWERGHERFFKEFRDKLTEKYAHMPWGG